MGAVEFAIVKDYFKTRTGLGILKGIVIVLVLAFVVAGIGALSGCSGTYMNNASVYAGLEHTKKVSPQCQLGSVDDHTTSNLGARLNLYTSADGTYSTNSKYTHHSCAFGRDQKSYDAIGIEAEYRFWAR
jgi:hypothetical protein